VKILKRESIRDGKRGYVSCDFSVASKQRLILLAAAALTMSLAHAQTQESRSRGAGGTVVRASAGSPAPASPNPVKADPEYVIGPGDLLAIDVWNEPGVTGKVPVRMDGKITVPLLGEIQASGLTPGNLELSISRKLNEFMKQPAVTVVVQEMNSHQFNVLGEVQKPGAFPLIRSTRVLDALAEAGGFRDFAKLKKIYVLRRTPSGGTVKLPFNYKRVAQGEDVQENVELQAGDTVFVP
jgi:polysaccharide biosynthesis/export protein